MYCLRYRMSIHSQNTEGSVRVRGSSTQSVKNRISLYDTLLDLLEEFDASGRAEIFRLLIERRSPIPLFLPNGQHHLPLINFGEDTDQLLCVTVISCRKKEDSQTAELLKEVFHLSSFHLDDGCVTQQSTTAEIGLGCLLPRSEKPVYLLVLNVVGDFDPLLDFVKEFSDYLIIEDSTNEDESFYLRPRPGIEGIGSVLVWKSSADSLAAKWFEGSDNEFGFEHLQIRSSLCKAFYNQIVTDLLDPEATHSKLAKKKTLLRQIPLLPGVLKEVECSVPYEFVSGKADRGELELQKSFNDQAKIEEEQSQNRNNESVRIETSKLIQKQVELRKELVKSMEKHPLLDLFLKLLLLEDANIRVLGFRELEKSLALQSELALGPLRTEMEKLPKSRQNKEFQEANERYHTTAISTEHLWRELSHFYAAEPSKFSKLILFLISFICRC